MNRMNEAATASNQQIPSADQNFDVLDSDLLLKMLEDDKDSNAVQISPRFPPGYRFLPTDTELILEYLKKKIDDEVLPLNHIPETNIYRYGPQQLSEMYVPIVDTKDKKIWYFFTSRYRKYTNGSRPDRTSGSGYWKATGLDEDVYGYKGTETENQVVGFKKVLVFIEGKPPRGVKTNWIMHEYVLNGETRKRASEDHMMLDDFVLCRIYNNKKQYASPSQGQGSSSNENNNSIVPIEIDDNLVVSSIIEDNLVISSMIDNSVVPSTIEDNLALPSTIENISILPSTIEDISALLSTIEDSSIFQNIIEDNSAFHTTNDYNSILQRTNDDNEALHMVNDDNSILRMINNYTSITQTTHDYNSAFQTTNDNNLILPTVNDNNSVFQMRSNDDSVLPTTNDDNLVDYSSVLHVVNNDTTAHNYNSILQRHGNSVLQRPTSEYNSILPIENSLIPRAETSADPSRVFEEPSEIVNYFSVDNGPSLLPSSHEYWSKDNYDPGMRERDIK